ncbi:cycloartenol synthase, partial [Verrucomicrobiota bacterium]
MTYSGMLALIHANISKDDVRVRSAFDWSVKHWSLRENPGMGKQGIYFFYNVLAKALSAYGRDVIPRADGHSSVNWRAALGSRLRDLQKTDPKTSHGYWSNESGRFWESDPVLVTSYAILALQTSTKK